MLSWRLRLLHAVPEQQEVEPPVLPQELISGLADVYQTSHRAGDRRTNKREELPLPALNSSTLQVDKSALSWSGMVWMSLVPHVQAVPSALQSDRR